MKLWGGRGRKTNLFLLGLIWNNTRRNGNSFSSRFCCEDIKTPWTRSSRYRKNYVLKIIEIENNFYRGNGVLLRHGLRSPFRLCVFVRDFGRIRVFLLRFRGLEWSAVIYFNIQIAQQKYAMFPIYLYPVFDLT